MGKSVNKPRSGVEFALILLTYVALGPPLGALAVMIAFAFVGIFGGGHPTGVWEHLWNLVRGSYLFGVLPAFIAGFVVSMQEHPSWRTVTFVGVAIGSLISMWFLWSQFQSLRGMEFYAAAWRGFLCITLPTLTCLVPTIVCWLVARLLLRLSRFLSSASSGSGHLRKEPTK